jgi:hypothetical protein
VARPRDNDPQYAEYLERLAEERGEDRDRDVDNDGADAAAGRYEDELHRNWD